MVRKTLEEVQGSFAGSTRTVTGLSLYLYTRGYWKLRRFHPFAKEKEYVNTAPEQKKTDAEWPALLVSHTRL